MTEIHFYLTIIFLYLFNLCIKKTAVDTLLMMITSSIHDLTYAVVVKYVKVRIHIILFVCFILCI